jgi:hypothetical protein
MTISKSPRSPFTKGGAKGEFLPREAVGELLEVRSRVPPQWTKLELA